MLYWNVNSDFDGEATIQITYFTSGITWSADYVAIATADEQSIAVESFVRVSNNSGEEYEDAQVRLVVGTINLVEKIAQLAQVSADKLSELNDEVRATLEQDAARHFLSFGDRSGGRGGGVANEPAQAKEIIKEGLSEYFIYTVEGTETIPNGWSKRMQNLDESQCRLIFGMVQCSSRSTPE